MSRIPLLGPASDERHDVLVHLRNAAQRWNNRANHPDADPNARKDLMRRSEELRKIANEIERGSHRPWMTSRTEDEDVVNDCPDSPSIGATMSQNTLLSESVVQAALAKHRAGLAKHYPWLLVFVREWTHGTCLVGSTHEDAIPFVTEQDAVEWVEAINAMNAKDRANPKKLPKMTYRVIAHAVVRATP
jgi:hypothetical protein